MGGVHDGGGGVPDAVTQLLGFGDGAVAVEAQLLGPGVEVLSDEHQLQPGFVADEVLAGQVAQPGVFGGADAVLESPWSWWRLGLVDSNHGVVGLLGSVERCFELCWRDVVEVAVQSFAVVLMWVIVSRGEVMRLPR